MKTPLFQLTDEEAFKRSFAVHFLATYVAINYDKWCSEGSQELLAQPPVEDADFLAEKAWKHWQKTLG